RTGHVYGSTALGGAHGAGYIFKVTRPGKLTTLYDFCSLPGCVDGKWPGGLTMDSRGDLYGAAWGGGENDKGAVFELSRSGSTWKESVLHSFSAGENSTLDPWGSLAVGTRKIGKSKRRVIFGITEYGGASDFGTVY